MNETFLQVLFHFLICFPTNFEDDNVDFNFRIFHIFTRLRFYRRQEQVINPCSHPLCFTSGGRSPALPPDIWSNPYSQCGKMRLM